MIEHSGKGVALTADKKFRILEAAAAGFARRGFDRTTVESIAQQADVAKGTVFLYFGNKAELFIAVLTELRIKVVEDQALQEAKSAALDIRSFVKSHLALSSSAPDLFRCYTSALFGVNRDFQKAALEIFEWQRSEIRRRLEVENKDPSGLDRQSTLLTATVIATALSRSLEPNDKADLEFDLNLILRIVAR